MFVGSNVEIRKKRRWKRRSREREKWEEKWTQAFGFLSLLVACLLSFRTAVRTLPSHVFAIARFGLHSIPANRESNSNSWQPRELIGGPHLSKIYTP